MKIKGIASLLTWASMILKALATLGTVPLIVHFFSSDEFAIWSILLTLLSLQLIVESGISTVFIRVFAYSRLRGATDHTRENDLGITELKHGFPKADFLARLDYIAHLIYMGVGLCTVITLLVFGSIAILPRAPLLEHSFNAWLSLIAMALVGAYRAYSGRYQSLMLGYDKFPETRIIECVSWALCFVCTLSAIVLSQNFLFSALIFSGSQLIFPILLKRLRDKFVEENELIPSPSSFLDKCLLTDLFTPMWRSVAGVFIFLAAFFGTGLIISTALASSDAAIFLLLVNLSRYLMQFSQVPFTVKIPQLTLLHAHGKQDDILKITKRSMTASMWLLTGAVIFVALLWDQAALHLKLDTINLDTALWGAIGLVTLLERYGAMHLQLYSTTNHIIWHWLNSLAALILTIVTAMLVAWIGLWSWVVGYLFSMLAYSLISHRHSFKAFGFPFPKFDLHTFIIPLSIGTGLYLFILLARASYL